MSLDVRKSGILCLLALLSLPSTGCYMFGMAPRTSLRQSQYRTNQLYGQNKVMSQDADGQRRMLAQMQQQNDQLRGNLDIANKRIDNLNSERSQLADRYKNMSNNNPLTPEANARFRKLVEKYRDKGIEFDENSGVAKLDSDLLFESGSDEVLQQADALLNDIARLMNDADTRALRVQIVGHTDDRPIVKQTTKAKHPTNWHLSTNRANSVLLALKKHGVDERRMRSAGANMFEGVADNKDPKARSKNRRVEIFLLAPDAKDVAAWEQQRN